MASSKKKTDAPPADGLAEASGLLLPADGASYEATLEESDVVKAAATLGTVLPPGFIAGARRGDPPIEIDGDGSPPFSPQSPPPADGRLVRCKVVGSNIKTEHRLYLEGDVDVFAMADIATSNGHLVPVDDTPES